MTTSGPSRGAADIRWFADLGHDDHDLAGGKGANLGELVRAGLPVPPGFVITTTVYRRFVAGSGLQAEIDRLVDERGAAASADISALFSARSLRADLVARIGEAYAVLSGDEPEVPVAVRSSATAEDLVEASFAGQQDSYLNVRGADDLVSAVQDCWASLWTERAIDYRSRQRVDTGTVALAVVVQRMVEAEAAGVMFTANPTTGRRDEVVIAAAWGLGEGVVGGQVDTDDLVVGPEGLRSRTTARKTTMITYAPTRTAAQPVPTDRVAAPVLDDDAALALAELGRRAATHFGRPQDLEWARAGGELFLLQSRPITALPEPEGPTPTDWNVPDATSWYFRASIVEQLPDPLSPLFADLIDGAVRRALQAVMGELLGRQVIRDADVGLPTINGYAYYAYSRGGMLRMLAQTPRALPVIAGSKRRSGIRRWREVSHPAYVDAVQAWSGRDETTLSAVELLAGVRELLDAGTAYYSSVQTIIPAAASSEVIFSRFYATVVRRAGDPPATTLLLGGDSSPIRAEKSLWDLSHWALTEPGLTSYLTRHDAATIATALNTDDHAPETVEAATWAEWSRRLSDHLATYGHAVYNLDFVNPVPVEAPQPVIEVVRFSLSGQGKDPYARQAALVAARDAATRSARARLDPVRRALFDRLLDWARTTAPVREDGLADVGLAWPWLRRLTLELGRRLVERGAVAAREDVFWLVTEEIEGDLTGTPTDRRATVADRRAAWRGRRRAVPPQVLPRTRMTRVFDHLLPAVADDQSDPTVIKGLGASAGRVVGTARVLSGPADFDQLRPGDILVAAITTPAWTSLFPMAGGVVTDIGGPLSHSSIVAREYGIPAVLGTGVATRRLRSGQRISVDGDTGTVRILDDLLDDLPDLPDDGP